MKPHQRALSALAATLFAVGCSSPACSSAEPQDNLRPVAPDDYLTPWAPAGSADWSFYTANNITCGISQFVVCIADPNTGLPGSKENNLVVIGADEAHLSWSATQAKPWGHAGEPFVANKHGEKLLEAGHSLTVAAGSCAVTDNSVIECRRGEHGFVIDPAGLRTY